MKTNNDGTQVCLHTNSHQANHAIMKNQKCKHACVKCRYIMLLYVIYNVLSNVPVCVASLTRDVYMPTIKFS